MKVSLDDKITPHFTWREFLFCPQWNVHVFPLGELHKQNILETCETLESIREILNSPLKIVSGYRPRRYNQIIGGAVESLHIQGLAADFIPTKAKVQTSKIALKSFLEELQCRMEDNGKGGWIHIDLGNVGPSGRFFKP